MFCPRISEVAPDWPTCQRNALINSQTNVSGLQPPLDAWWSHTLSLRVWESIKLLQNEGIEQINTFYSVVTAADDGTRACVTVQVTGDPTSPPAGHNHQLHP